jgi:hypothetical protein
MKGVADTKQESSPWTKRFIAAAILQGAIIVSFLLYAVLGYN